MMTEPLSTSLRSASEHITRSNATTEPHRASQSHHRATTTPTRPFEHNPRVIAFTMPPQPHTGRLRAFEHRASTARPRHCVPKVPTFPGLSTTNSLDMKTVTAGPAADVASGSALSTTCSVTRSDQGICRAQRLKGVPRPHADRSAEAHADRSAEAHADVFP
jgi:hypothetical protein